MYFNFISFGIGLELLILLAFLVLRWLQIPVGSFLDWVIGSASFWWLIVIVTVPWNLHFQAKEVLADADISAEKGTAIEPKQRSYLQMLAQRSLLLAIALHIFSAVGLYAVAATGITPIGYISAGAALLLTILRPAVRAYEYLMTRLAMIRQEFLYPREDIFELRQRFSELEEKVKHIAETLDLENVSSWAVSQQNQWDALRQDLTRLAATQEDLRATNQAEHQRLSREAEQAIAQLTTDGQFLDHVREIIRFFKSA
jgi:hypothetical protein